MEKLEDRELDSHLTLPERVAKQLGSVEFEGLHCPMCYPERAIGCIHIRGFNRHLSHVRERPTCQEFTVTREIDRIV